VAALAELVARIGPAGIAIDAAVALVIILGTFLLSRRNRVAHHNVNDRDGADAPRAKKARAR
jgi:PiT family inorganic phosphate transporter